MRLRTAHLLVLALCAAMAASAEAGTYLLWEEFDGNDGGFVVVNGGAVEGPWVWDSVAGTWRTDGTANQGTPTFSELNSPFVTVAQDGSVLLEFDHRYSFEYGWDGGQVRISLNGGAYQTVPGASFLANGYDGTVSGWCGTILDDQEAFTGDSAGFGAGAFLTSEVDLGIFQAGDQVSVQFVGAWDENTKGSIPNWEINSAAVWYSLMVRWTGAVSNDWYDADNWDPAGTPPDDAFRVVESGQPIASTALFARDGGSITIAGSGSTCMSPDLYVGGSDTQAGGVGAVTVSDGGLLEVGHTLKLWPGGRLDAGGGKVRIGSASDPGPGQLRIGPTGTLEIAGGQVTCGAFDNSAGGSLSFPGGTLTVDGGAFQPGAGDFTLGGGGEATLRLTNGATADLDADDLIVGGSAVWVPGLRYGVLDGQFNETDQNPRDQGVQLGPMASEIKNLPGGTTHVYTGEFYDFDGNVSFYENFDDSVLLLIDGQEFMRYSQPEVGNEWQIPHSTGDLQLSPDSWHTFELRLGQGGGGSGPPSGMTLGFGFDNVEPISDANDQTQYVHPEDPGDGSLFRTEAAGSLEVLSGAVVTTANGYVGLGEDSGGVVTIDGNGPGGPSRWTVSGGLYLGGSVTAAGGVGSVRVAGAGRLDVGETLKLWPGGSLTVAGGGVRIGSPALEPIAGELRIGHDGTLDLAGGTVTCGAFDNSEGGTFVWTSGTLVFSGDLRIDSNAPFGATGGDTLCAGRTLTVADTLEITSSGTLGLDGGQVTCGAFSNMVGGTFAWASGTLGFTGALPITSDAPFGTIGLDRISAGRTLAVADALTIAASGVLDLYGGQVTCGSFDNSAGGLFFWNSGTLAFSGELGIDSDAPFGAVEGDAITAGRVLQAGILRVGFNGAGTLTIQGGAVETEEAFIGFWPAAHGTVTVEGAGSSWSCNGQLLVGAHGTALLTVRDGGSVTSADGYVSGWQWSHAEAFVEDPCSTWTNSGDFSVGRYKDGVGSLTIRSGGRVSDANGYVGYMPGAEGTVTVDGSGSRWRSSGGLYVGGSDTTPGGTGQLAVSDGGLVEVGQTLKVWPGGRLDVLGGKVRIGGAADPGAGQVRIGPDGTLSLHGGQVTCGSLDDSAGGTLDLTAGTLTVDGGAFEPPDGDFALEGTGNPRLRLTNGATANLDADDLIVAGHADWVPGLNYGVLDGQFNEAEANPRDQGVQLGPMASEIRNPPLPALTTHVYTGLFYDADGHVSFYENFDDSVKLLIDGQEVMRYSQPEFWDEYLTPHSTGDLSLAPDRWHTFELRLGQGIGGSGPPGGMTLGFGFDNDPLISDANDETQYVHPVDPGDGSLFRSLPPAGTLEVLAGAVVTTANGYVGLAEGSRGVVTIDNDGPGGPSRWTVSGGLYLGGSATAAGGVGIVRVVGAGRLEVGQRLKLWPGGSLTVDSGGVRIGDPTVEPSAGELRIGPDGTLDLAGGTVTCGSFHNSEGGTFAWSSGTLAFPSELLIDSDAPFEAVGGDAITAGRVLQAGNFGVGYSGNGTLTVANGGNVLNANAGIGCLADSQGTVTVRDPRSTWENSGSLYVGGSETAAGGTGTVTVSNGGRLEVGEALKIWPGGTVEVSGGTIRLADPCSLDRQGGTFAFHFGTIEFDTDLEITSDTGLLTELFGAHPSIAAPNGLGITGQATLRVPVTLDGGTFSVGSLANAGLLQFRSGTFRLTDANLAVGPGGLFGPALRLERGQHVDVTKVATVAPGGMLSGDGGRLSAGALEVLAGGEVSVGPGERLTIGGPATNRGGQLTLGGGTLHFEQSLTNTDGGVVMGNGLLRADGGVTNAATMAFSGVANVVGDVTNQPAGLIIASGGGPTTFFDDVVNDGEIRIGQGATAVFFGGYSGAGSFPGPGTACFEGDLKPGSSPAVVTFGGSVAFGPGAGVEIELAGGGEGDLPSPGCDGLIVGGDVALGGTLALAWLPVAGDPGCRFGGAYTIVTWGGDRSGEFASVGGQLAAYLDTSLFPDGIEYDDANGLLRVHLHGLLDGDVDLDGAVGPNDLSVLEAAFGSADAGWLDGDVNFDRSVDHLDYLLWKANAGQAVPGATIPEPATLGLLGLGMAWVVGPVRSGRPRRWSRRRSGGRRGGTPRRP